MASEKVLTALESLHKELEKLEPAIKHVEAAQQVTQLVKGITQKHVDLLAEIKNDEFKHKEKLTTLFSKELTALTEENKKLQENTYAIQQVIRTEQESLNKLKNNIHDFHEKLEKIDFPGRLDVLNDNVLNISKLLKKQQLNSYITWILIAIGITLVTVLMSR
ncbi:hypothetical protein QNI16_10380 [Cytophagaceae bacterium YF14B1]|uniref:Uncharacterized protein n=1 Tax=Xanthocytophaga flava TaxID=3048013 RepID=A0AAE3QNY3_9BACT|nr:hypothetical protein [Xanthocytophaga flavus]MDJ1480890.1 hypothetical protein [Xanthocytophaga flavus]